MPKILFLIQQLQSSVLTGDTQPTTFTPGDTFWWNYRDKQIVYDPSDEHASDLLLHETGHALLNHQAYPDDMSLIAMERDAWTEALRIADSLSLSIDKDNIDDAMDTYRDWLHARSTCPNCTATGVQSSLRHYACLACHHEWSVNEARLCALRRRDTKKRSV